MICNGKPFFELLLLCALLIICTACPYRSSEKKALQELEAVLGKELIVGPDRIWRNNRPKIVTILTDTGTCTSCNMQLRDWYHYKIALDNDSIGCDIVYVLSDSVEVTPLIDQLVDDYGLHYVKGAEDLIRKNHLPAGPFRTFLIDSARTIRMVGSPLYKGRLWNLYKKILNGEKV